MSGDVTISFWLFIFLIAVAAWAILERVLIPSTRWFIRRRINRLIDEISTRLDIQIKPFQLTKRQVLIDRLVYDPKVVEAIQENANERNCPREMVQNEVMAYAREIVPSFNAYLYFRIGYWMAKKIARFLYRVRIGIADEQRYALIDPESTVVFVINHRSNMDYVLVAFLAAEKTTLSYAVGEWAKIWPLQTLIRAMGAFFVRRNSSDPLYRRVLERYVHMATKEGVCQAVFLEGGLSRDGRLRPPKLGFLDYMLRSYDAQSDRDIVFIPVGVNYDRTLEDRSLLRELDPDAEKRSRWFIIKTTCGFIWKSLLLMILSRWQRFGYAYVNFGNPVSVSQYCADSGVNFARLERPTRFAEVEKLANRLMDAIRQVVPVLPVSLVATVLLEAQPDGLHAAEVQERVNRCIAELERLGAHVYLSPQNRVESILNALNMLKLRKLVGESDGVYWAVPDEVTVLTYYTNAIAHWRQRENRLNS
ncbi:MAG: 1-acyl-sn-glycerol-3-phosphate acyltransferase [Desulfobacterales bacterium]|jgi:glycerol-3-phosphate O-acyltransferase